MQPAVVDFQVLDAVEHLHALVLQARSVDPASGLAQAVAYLGCLALQQEHLARRCVKLWRDAGNPAARF
ncbi:hypothetical protein D3C81_2009460 [compost metagenome]